MDLCVNLCIYKKTHKGSTTGPKNAHILNKRIQRYPKTYLHRLRDIKFLEMSISMFLQPVNEEFDTKTLLGPSLSSSITSESGPCLHKLSLNS
jgi:hypothetical protein